MEDSSSIPPYLSWLSNIPLAGWVLALGAVASIVAYAYGFLKVAPLRGTLRRYLWFLPPYVTRYAHDWAILLMAAIIVAYLIFLTSLGFVELTPELPFHSSAGILFAFAGFACTLASLLNTVALLNQRLGHIQSFEGLFYRMNEIRREIEERNPRRPGALRNPEEALYLLDYTPRVGEISSPPVGEGTYRILKSLGSLETCECHFVFLPSEGFLESVGPSDADLERFYKRSLGRKVANISLDLFEERVLDYVNKAESAIAGLECDTVAIWRSRRIHSEHYLVARDSALAYYVRPETNGDRNELKGEKTEDLAQVEYLRDVVRDYIRDAITPHLEHCDNCGGVVLCFDVGQSNIDAIEIYLGATPSFLLERNLQSLTEDGGTGVNYRNIPIRGALSPGFECKYVVTDISPEMRWIRIRLRKISRRGDDGGGPGAAQALTSPPSYILSLDLLKQRKSHGKEV